ncbi:MAG: type II secretion system protein GspM [Betaproteobacteria bacterium]
MAARSPFVDSLKQRVLQAAKPAIARWDVLTPQQRSTATFSVVFLLAALTLAFMILPAINARLALQERIPRLESQLSVMRSQAAEIAVLAKQPIAGTAPRDAASVANLQSIFGPTAQITTAANGFRVVIPAIEYVSWWDKTGEAIAGHGLVLRETSLGRTSGATAVAVDMRLTFEAGTSTPTVTPTSPGK